MEIRILKRKIWVIYNRRLLAELKIKRSEYEWSINSWG